MKEYIKQILKENKILFEILQKMYHHWLSFKYMFKRVLFSPFLLLPIRKNKIFIVSYKGQGYGDSGKALIEEIKNSGDIEDYELVWAINHREQANEFPGSVKLVKYASIKFYYHMSTAKVWIDNSRKEEHSFKRKNQYYVQVWHGGLSFKKIEADAEDKLSAYYLSRAKRDSKMADLMTANSTFQKLLIKKSFWFDDEILEIGTPRVDYLINNNTKLEKLNIRSKLKISKTNEIIMYAPTFRNSHSYDAYIQNFDNLSHELGENVTILIRLHPNMSHKSWNFSKTNIINVSHYPDMYELMLVSDILITDYSSTMFEFSLMKKPVFLYTKDYNQYQQERGSYFNLDQLPFLHSKTESDLIESIKSFDETLYLRKLDTFLNQLGVIEDGNASKKLLEHIDSVINQQ